MEQNSWNLRRCFAIIKRKVWLIILIAAIATAICGTIIYYSEAKIKSEYEISATILIKEPEVYTRNQTELSHNEYQAINNSIMNHFSNLIKMDIVVDEVIDELQLAISCEEFKDKMDIEIISNSNMLKLQIKNKDPEMAEKISGELITVSSKKAREILGIANIEIIDRTKTNITPVKSIKKQDILISGILGVLISLTIILLPEYLDKTVKNLKDAEFYLGSPAMKIIEGSNTGDKLVVRENPESFSAETYRNAIINIRLMQKEDDKIIVFTSPMPNKYKSKVTANMAIALSRTGKKVLLIDGDLRNSSISKFFGMDDSMGLSDIITNEIDLNDVIQKSEMEKNLFILASGQTLFNPVDILALQKMNTLLEKTADNYDAIFIDSPSLKIVADTIILSTVSDATVLICEAGQTKIKDVISGKEKLERVNSSVLGMILQTKDLKEYEYVDIY